MLLRPIKGAHYALMYRAALAAPTFRTLPERTIAPRVASTVVGLTSGSAVQISALEIGTSLPSTRASIAARLVLRRGAAGAFGLSCPQR